MDIDDESLVESDVAPPEEPVTPWSDPPCGPIDAADSDAREWLHNTFAAVMTSLDAELGAVFDHLRVHGLDTTALWLLTSDLGFPLGEHGQIGLHRPWLYEELVHLPLLMRLPEAAESCRRVSGFTQTPDVAATLLSHFEIEPPPGMAGSNLLPLARGEETSIRPHAKTTLDLGPAAESAIRTQEWAYLLPIRVPEGETREPLLFQKPDDLKEVNDLRRRNIERADELEAKLNQSD
jgi:arylsulfatase A-like enzyme